MDEFAEAVLGHAQLPDLQLSTLHTTPNLRKLEVPIPMKEKIKLNERAVDSSLFSSEQAGLNGVGGLHFLDQDDGSGLVYHLN